MQSISVLAFTSSRADYSPLRPVLSALAAAADFELCVVAGGSHCSSSRASISAMLQADGISDVEFMPYLLAGDDVMGITTSVGIGLSEFGAVLHRRHPDFVLILGDRYDLFVPALSAAFARIPVVHMHGGERTEGAIDDTVRHAITKLSHVHLVAMSEYAQTVSALGEEDWRIHIVGAPGLNTVMHLVDIPIHALENQIGLSLDKPTLLCTYHPPTASGPFDQELQMMLDAIDDSRLQVVFTGCGAEVGSETIRVALADYVSRHRGSAAYIDSLGAEGYLSLAKHCVAVLGNSSSGIVEVPSLGVPTINIGSRQRGRVQPRSVIDCDPSSQEALARAIERARTGDWTRVPSNPYGDGHADKYVLAALRWAAGVPRERLLHKLVVGEVNQNEWHRYF